MLLRFKNLRLLPIRQRCMSTKSGEEDVATVYDREFADMKVEDFEELYTNDPQIKEKIEIILNEYEYAKYNSLGRVPVKIDLNEMNMFLEEGVNLHKREKLLSYLYAKEMAKRQQKNRKARLKEETRARKELKHQNFQNNLAGRTGLLDGNGNIVYGLWHNSLFCRIPENKLKSGSSASRLINAAMFGQKLIFDFGYDEYMDKYIARNAVDQLQEAYGMNRFNYREPFDFWFCNFDKNTYSAKYCSENAIQNLYSGSMITVKEDCFTNHFDKSRLVYLSPHAKQPLGKINKADDIYILGVYNDKGSHQPLSYRKALKLGIRTKCLPIDTHVPFKGPSKCLCINHVTGILLEVIANGGDWHAALMKHIPKRSIKPLEVVLEEERRRDIKQESLARAAKLKLRNDFW